MMSNGNQTRKDETMATIKRVWEVVMVVLTSFTWEGAILNVAEELLDSRKNR